MYQLDADSARKGDQSGRFISEIGKYVGVFTRAEDITAKTGTKGVAFTFESEGQTANLTLYTLKSNGEKIMGYDFLMAIMTCLSCRQLNQTAGRVKKWDSETNSEKMVDTTVFPELMNKPIGLLLETEDYLKKDGTVIPKMVIAGIFQASTELTASEILDKKVSPEKLAKRVMGLRHRPLKGVKNTPAPSGGTSKFDDMDDDIPF